MVTLYLNQESTDILRKLKKEEENFNLSNFLQQALYNHTGKGLKELNDIYKKIADRKLKIDYLNNEVIFLENRVNEINKELEHLENIKKEEDHHTIELNEINEFLNNTDTTSTDSEYRLGLITQEWKGLVDYAKKKLNK